MWNPNNVQYNSQKGDEKRPSRYGKSSNPYKRCMECGKFGHFKCTSEQRSRIVGLTFDVAENLNEFLLNSDEEEEFPKSDLKKREEKREDKRQRKEAKR